MGVDGQRDNGNTAVGASGLGGFASSDLIGELTRRIQFSAEQENRIKERERRMFACAADPKEVLDINAGGRIHSVTRETLLLAKGSVLAAMFSGNWDNALARDSEGRPFLDIDPYIFDVDVNYLRQKRFEGPDSPAPLPVIDPGRAREYKRVITYLGLTDLLEDAAPAKVQSLSEKGSVETRSDSIPKGYVIRLTKPIRLKAVLVGLSPGSAAARVVFGRESVCHYADLKAFNRAPSEWKVSDQELTHCADVPDIILKPPEFFVKVTATGVLSYKYVLGDSGVRGAGPFKIVSKIGLPPQLIAQASRRILVCTDDLKMSLVYTDVDE